MVYYPFKFKKIWLRIIDYQRGTKGNTYKGPTFIPVSFYTLRINLHQTVQKFQPRANASPLNIPITTKYDYTYMTDLNYFHVDQ